MHSPAFSSSVCRVGLSRGHKNLFRASRMLKHFSITNRTFITVSQLSEWESGDQRSRDCACRRNLDVCAPRKVSRSQTMEVCSEIDDDAPIATSDKTPVHMGCGLCTDCKVNASKYTAGWGRVANAPRNTLAFSSSVPSLRSGVDTPLSLV